MIDRIAEILAKQRSHTYPREWMHLYRDNAREIIKAMREPTDSMMSGFANRQQWVVTTWHSMIDAALEDKK